MNYIFNNELPGLVPAVCAEGGVYGSVQAPPGQDGRQQALLQLSLPHPLQPPQSTTGGSALQTTEKCRGTV